MKLSKKQLKRIVRKVLLESQLGGSGDQIKLAIASVVKKYTQSAQDPYPNLYESHFDTMHSHVLSELGMSGEEAEAVLEEMYHNRSSNTKLKNLGDAIVYKYVEDYIEGAPPKRLYYVWEMKVFELLGWDYDDDYDRFEKELSNLLAIREEYH